MRLRVFTVAAFVVVIFIGGAVASSTDRHDHETGALAGVPGFFVMADSISGGADPSLADIGVDVDDLSLNARNEIETLKVRVDHVEDDPTGPFQPAPVLVGVRAVRIDDADSVAVVTVRVMDCVHDLRSSGPWILRWA